MFYAVIQIDTDHLIGKVMDFLLKCVYLLGLFLYLLQLFAQPDPLGSPGGLGDTVFQIGDCRAESVLLWMDVIGTDTGDGIRLIAVHIEQTFETVLFTGIEQPVDRAFLVNFQMVGIETVQEVIPDHFTGDASAAQRVGDKSEIRLQRITAVNRAHKVHKARDNIAGKIFIVQNRNDRVFLRLEGGILRNIPRGPRKQGRVYPENTARTYSPRHRKSGSAHPAANRPCGQ